MEALARELWIVTHADLRRTARVRAFMELVGGELSRRRDRIAALASAAGVGV